MATFHVSATVTAESFYEMEANSEEEAENIVERCNMGHMTEVNRVFDAKAKKISD